MISAGMSWIFDLAFQEEKVSRTMNYLKLKPLIFLLKINTDVTFSNPNNVKGNLVGLFVYYTK